ncbi:MAG: DUF3575 domain-containing protein [Bacteroidales bacterium]|jgi:hypothetical protein|nr:DUF3575 domain-containing protein [Bacteroidales bacterium]
MKLKLLVISMAAFLFGTAAMGQTVALKTNLLYDATATVNAGLELGMAPQWTIDLNGNYNGWSTGGIKKWEHILVNPEVRYWLCERFAGHFFGLHAIGQQFNIGGLDFGAKILGTDFSLLKDHLYKGWGLGAGIGYGYDFVLGKHWNLELEAGLGYVYTRYNSYLHECKDCARKVSDIENSHNYFGPTKAAINIVYLF